MANDICCVQDGDKKLFVVTCRSGGIIVCNSETNRLQWKVNSKLAGVEKKLFVSGVTSDGHGHIFVCDPENECVHIFAASDGSHLGILFRKGERNLGTPWKIDWCQGTSTLVVAHKRKNSYCSISVLNINELPI